MTGDHRHLSDVVLDVDDADLASALVDAFAPHPTHRRSATATGAAVQAVADLPAAVIVVAPPATPTAGDGTDQDVLHDDLALRVWRWVEAAAVVGACVVVVSRDDVFESGATPSGGHDEFAVGDATDPIGRARRAGEGQVRSGLDVLVRAAAGDDPAAIAGLVRWAALEVRPGTWHLPDGTSPLLHATHTARVRTVTDGRPDTSRPGVAHDRP